MTYHAKNLIPSALLPVMIMTAFMFACTSPPIGIPAPNPVLTVTTEVQTAVQTPMPTAQPSATSSPIPPTAEVAPTPAATALPEIVIPISIYILDDDSGSLSSDRTVEELAEIYGRVNDIWSQANIRVDVQIIERVTVPNEMLIGLTRRDFFTFFNAVNREEIILPEFSPITGFYVKELGGPNGINPSNSNVFFVMDTPSVHDERVTSHEIGHILGLHHVLTDPGRLLYSGTNGVTLSDEEIIVARYSASGLLDRVR